MDSTVLPLDADQPLRPLTRLQQAAIAFGTVAMGAGMSISFVVVAPLARDAGLSEIAVAGILTISTLMFTFMIPLWGRLADRFGRKRVMVFSLLMMSLTNAGFIFALDAALTGLVTGASTFFLLAFVRFWYGLLTPGLQPASMAAMADATTLRTRAAGMGLLGAGMSFGTIIGPAGAAVLANISALAPIWGAVGLSCLAALVIGFVLPKTRTGAATGAKPAPLPLRDRRILPMFAFLLAYFGVVAAVQQTIAWLIKDRYGLGRADAVEAAGLVMASLAIVLVIVQFGYVTPRKPDPRKMLPAGLAAVAAGYGLTVLAPSLWVMCLGFGVVGLGAALCVPAMNAIGTLSVTPQEQGQAAALLSAAPPGGYILGPLIGAGLYMLHPVLPLAISAAAILGFMAFAIVRFGNAPLGETPTSR